MNRFRAVVVSALGVAVLVMPTMGARATTSLVIERGTQYVPAQVDISAGDTVSWVFESAPTGSAGHTVTFSDRDLNPNCPPQLLLNDCQRSPGDRVSRTFSAPGTYAYHCKIHSGMTGVVVVAAAPSSTTGSTASSSTTTTTVRASTTTTLKATSSTTSTTRQLATSSTLVKSTTTTADTSSAVLPGAPPSLAGDDGGKAAGKSTGSGGGDKSTVALIVGLLLVVSGGGGYLLWRLRPSRT